VERAALRGTVPAPVRAGMGPARARAARRPGPSLVVGVAGALVPGVSAGDLVVATEVRRPDGEPVPVPSAPLLAGALRRLGLTVHTGPLASSPVLVAGPGRAALAGSGALAVDMESAWLVPDDGSPYAALRAIVDTPQRPLFRPGTPVRGVAALRALRRARPAVAQWFAALGAHELVLSDNPEHDKPEHTVGGASDLELGRLAGDRRICVSAGASAPPRLVDDLVRALSGLGPVAVHDTRITLSREVS
jgi:4-hydroxy-3-methylbut-2-enyl diphosphate reductase